MAYIDVIIPVYNCRKYLTQAVKSVKEQPYKDISILLVDDGSTDGSSELCDEIAKISGVEVVHQNNGGVSCARNTGIENVLLDDENGWIAFLDADDFWWDNTITEDVVRTFDSKNADLIAMESVTCDESGSLYEKPVIHDNHTCDGGESIIWKFPMHFGSIFYSKRLLKDKEIRFFKGLRYSEDKMFLQQAAALSRKVYFSNTLLYVYRKNRNSAMEMYTKMISADYYLPIINGWIKSDEFINKSLSRTDYGAGKTLAGIYFLDMVSEHCMQHRKLEEILKICYNHPNFDLFINMQPENVNEKQYKEHNLLINHPVFFLVKYNIIGFIKSSLRKIVYTKLLYKWYKNRRFPYKRIDLLIYK